jgi:hypothetical protein
MKPTRSSFDFGRVCNVKVLRILDEQFRMKELVLLLLAVTMLTVPAAFAHFSRFFQKTAAKRTLPKPRISSPIQVLRQTLELWPYLFLGVSLAGLVYQFWRRGRTRWSHVKAPKCGFEMLRGKDKVAEKGSIFRPTKPRWLPRHYAKQTPADSDKEDGRKSRQQKGSLVFETRTLAPT